MSVQRPVSPWASFLSLFRQAWGRRDHQALATEDEESAEPEHRHQRLRGEKTGESQRSASPSRLSWASWALLNGLMLVVAVSVTWKMASSSMRPPTHLIEESFTPDGKRFPHGQLTFSRHFDPLPCGRTPDEAKASGCHFDMVATAWLPERCIDRELVDEFMGQHRWAFFADSGGRQRLSEEDPDLLGSYTGGRIWTTHRWHAAHCLYMWKKLTRAMASGRGIDSETVWQHHVDHCVDMILRRGPLESDEMTAIVEVIYPPC